MDDAAAENYVPSKRDSVDALSLPVVDGDAKEQEGDQLSVLSDNDEEISLGLELDEETSERSGNRIPIFINITRTSPIPVELRPNGHAGNGE